MDATATARTDAAPLAPRRPAAVAGLAAAVAGLILASGGVGAWEVVTAATAGTLVWLAAIDLERRLVPNRIVLGSLVLVLAAAFAVDPATGAAHALAGLLAGASFLTAALVRPGALGIGDVKLVALLGALLGAGVLGALTVGFLLLGVAALALVVREGRSALARQLPLVPFLAAGAIATLLAG